MTIVDMAKSSLERLNKVREARDGVDEAHALQGLHEKLLQLAAPLLQHALNAKLLASEGLNLSPVNEVGKSIDIVKKVSEVFEQDLKSTTLKQGTRWTQLSKSLLNLETIVSQSQVNDWKIFFENKFFGGGSPTQKEGTLPKTPANENALTEYKSLYQKFNGYRTNIPRNVEEFTNLRELSYKLSQIQFQVGDDVPDAVQKFFAACNTGASLELLTNEVIEWLRNNNLLGSYIVRAKT